MRGARAAIRFAVLALLAVASSFYGSAEAAPALFVARTDGLTLYLFGSLSFVPSTSAWKTDRLTQAFKSANGFVFQVSLSTGLSKLEQAIDGDSFAEGRTLWSYLSASESARLMADLQNRGWSFGPDLPVPKRPWAVVDKFLRPHYYRSAGLDTPGPEFVLQEDALRAGRPVLLLNRDTEWAGFDADLPDEVSAARVRRMLLTIGESDTATKRLVSAWEAGDLDVLTRRRSELEDLALVTVPYARDAELVRIWATQPRLGRTYFVTLGVEHLVGPGNLRERLAETGYTLERIQ